MNNKLFEKKDLVYWLIILGITNIMTLTVRLGDNTNVVNYISFAGTIMSTLLAVIAIIYSFYQSFLNINANQKLNESVEKIEDVTRKIDESTKRKYSVRFGKLRDSLEPSNNIMRNFMGIAYTYLAICISMELYNI